MDRVGGEDLVEEERIALDPRDRLVLRVGVQYHQTASGVLPVIREDAAACDDPVGALDDMLEVRGPELLPPLGHALVLVPGDDEWHALKPPLQELLPAAALSVRSLPKIVPPVQARGNGRILGI